MQIDYKLEQEYIELYKLIKFLNLVDSGAEAKLLIANEMVTRNGEIETRKRAKIRDNEIIQVGNVTIKT